MDRRKFFKNLGVGTALAVTAPILAAELLKDEPDKFDGKKVDDGFLLDEAGHHETEGYIGLTANINNKHFFLFKREHNLKPNDTIFVTGGELNSNYIVTDIFNERHLKAIPTKENFMLNGEVAICHIGRDYAMAESVNGTKYYYKKWDLLEQK